jgi:hypothetical protein
VGKKIDLSGQRFGKLVALKDVGRTKSGGVLWNCLCDCGKTHVVAQGNLHSGGIKSCGCAERTGTWHYNDLTGKVFERLTVLGIDHKSNHGIYWKCQCSCGNFSVVRCDGLVTGNTRSCGCLMLDMSREKAKRLFTKHGLSGTKEYSDEKSRKRRELKIVHDYLWTDKMTSLIKKIQPACVICGMTDQEHLEKYGTHLNIDHVLPLSKGYGLKPGNAVVLCQHHNGKKLAKKLNELPVEWQASLIWAAFKFKDCWMANNG